MCPNLGRIFSLFFYRPSHTPPNSFQFHLVSLCAFTRQDVLTLKIAVHHDDRSLVIIQIPDNGGNLFDLCQFADAFPPVPGHDLIASVIHWTHDNGHQHTVFPDALHSFLHSVIVHNTERMILEWHKLG